MAPVVIPPPWEAAIRHRGHDAAAIIVRINRLLGDGETVPRRGLLLRALELCPPEDARVLILGQDPYPTPGHAIGLAFAVPGDCTPIPGSLRNILDEVEACTSRRPSQDLEAWAAHGVLLLNRWLSLDERPEMRAAWDQLTAAVVHTLVEAQPSPLAVLAWGRQAMDHLERRSGILAPAACAGPRCYLKSSHPSPLGYYRSTPRAPAFRGCRHFRLANDWLASVGGRPIPWSP